MTRVKIVNNGASQVVELPEACRFPEDQREVIVRRSGRKIILEPADERADEWPPEFIRTLGALTEDLERPPSEDISEMKDPFE